MAGETPTLKAEKQKNNPKDIVKLCLAKDVPLVPGQKYAAVVGYDNCRYEMKGGDEVSMTRVGAMHIIRGLKTVADGHPCKNAFSIKE